MSCFAVTLMKSRRCAFPSNFQWEINEGGGGGLPPSFVFASRKKYSIYVVKILQIGGI